MRYLAILAILLMAGCNSLHPMVKSADTLDKTIIPYTIEKIKNDPELDDIDKDAMLSNIQAFRYMLEEAKKNE